jgi:hypothetical protein
LDNPVLVKRIGKAGREAVLEKYNWSKEAAKLLAFYDELGMRPLPRLAQDPLSC